ncbi:PfkB family carbohydrate kinase [Roseivivax isoporae]|uniref:Ribokinase n=1 Tax=Roseivivax isoporae LMG 25204 TaxID=1449351 RepID=X7F851_9RHOB|nr:PfkB family carbohydrate kinase [Roseivivax isoporae]ETX28970.1 ribokinase [Roseivivax isoporae LMG 25204]
MGALMQMSAPVVDLVYSVAALPARGQEAHVTDFAMLTGGGYNAMAAARAAGQRVVLGGSLGTGPMADRVAADLARLGIGLARPRLGDRDQGCCTVLLEPDGERTFVAAPGAEGHVPAGALAGLSLDGISHVLLSGYSLHYPGAAGALTAWVEALPAEIAVVFDPSPVVHLLPEELLARAVKRADWISANAAEAAVLSAIDDPGLAAVALSKDREGALVRLGADGCLMARGGQVAHLVPHPVAAVDTNGAGDTHIGSFIAELARHGDALRAARYANVAAALSTLHKGPATPPDRASVTAILDPNHKAGQRPNLNRET